MHRNYFPAVERHIPCTETVAWEEVSSEMSCNWNSGCKRNPERSSTMHHLEFLCKLRLGKRKRVFDLNIKPETRDHVITSQFKWGPKKHIINMNFCLRTWILIELLPPHHVFRNGSFWQAFLPYLSSFDHPEGCCSHGSASQFAKIQKLYMLKRKKVHYIGIYIQILIYIYINIHHIYIYNHIYMYIYKYRRA